MSHALLYARLSRAHGQGQDISIERQVQQFHTWLKTRTDLEHNCQTDDYVEDAAGWHSGTSSSKRPRYRALVDFLNQSRGHLLWVVAQDRLSRGQARDLLLSMSKRDHQFVIDNRTINLETFTDDLGVAANDFVSLMYAISISHKQRSRIAEEKAHHAKMGFPPQGLVFSGKGLSRTYAIREETYTAPDGTPRRYIDTIIAFFREYAYAQPPIGLPEVSKRLRAAGYLWRAKDGSPQPIHFKKLDDLTFENYRGFVDDKLLDAAIERRNQRAKRKQNGRRIAPQFSPTLLYRLVYCATCGARLRYHRSHTRYAFYCHPSAAVCERTGEVRDYKIDEQVLKIPAIVRLAHLSDEDKDRIAKRAVELSDAPSTDRHKSLEDELNRLEDLAISGLLRKEKYATRHAAIMAELQTLGEVTTRPQLGYDDYHKVLDDMQHNLADVFALAPWDANAIMASVFESVSIDVPTAEVVSYKLKQSAAIVIG